MDGGLALFAIEAGVKLGRKIHEVLIDETVERPLLLPVGDLYADIDVNRASRFFDRDENAKLVEPGGPYHDFSDDDLVLAYKTLRSINERAQPAGELGDATEIVLRLHAFEQYKEGFGAQPAVRRILGTIVEIGIDYFDAHPEAMGRDSSARRIVHSFVAELQETDFAEDERREIVGDLLRAALRTLDANVTLLDDDERTQALLGGMTQGLIEVVDGIDSVSGKIELEDLLERIGSGLLAGAAAAFTENIDLFIRRDDTAKALVKSTLVQVLEGIKGKQDLFTNESLELVFKSALTAVGENAEIFSSKPIVRELIARTVKALTNAQGRRLFSRDTVGAIVVAALEVVRDNIETVVDADDPQEQLLASTVSAIARGLASGLAQGGTAKDLLSKNQLVALVKLVFEEVAKHPEQLIEAEAGDQRKMAVAQIIGSVAAALGQDPGKLVNGSRFVELVRIATRVAIVNADKLIDFGSPSTKKNLIFKILQQIVLAVSEGIDTRGLVSRDVFLEIAERVLRVTSANLEPILGGQDAVVKDTVLKVLELATGVLENRTNGDNLPYLVEEILRQVLWGELNLDEASALERAALDALRDAA